MTQDKLARLAEDRARVATMLRNDCLQIFAEARDIEDRIPFVMIDAWDQGEVHVKAACTPATSPGFRSERMKAAITQFESFLSEARDRGYQTVLPVRH